MKETSNGKESSDSTQERIGRLDVEGPQRRAVLPYCRLKPGEIWEDPESGHRVGLLDANDRGQIESLFRGKRAQLFVNDPPYNVTVGNRNTRNLPRQDIRRYIEFSRRWIENCLAVMDRDAHLYIWMGADYRNAFQPLPEFVLLMREFSSLQARNWITLRNQRGYGTRKNWMWVRQELLHYVKGSPDFRVVYTEIPKILKGYYKTVEGKMTENLERSHSGTIRPGNVWVDIQQVFYRTEENVPGCYAQKPLRATERILHSSSDEGHLVADFFSHSGTTLLAGEILCRRVFTLDFDPVFAELTIRRLEHYRRTGRTGWQWRNPFPEIGDCPELEN